MNDDFSISRYESLVERAKASRIFVGFEDSREKGDTKRILWRHDVDVSLRAALRLAEIDHKLGVSSNFFINVHSDTYNARSDIGRKQVRSLIDLGHRVEIHLDTAYYGSFSCKEQLEEALSDELRIFREAFGVEVKAFSFHNPTQVELRFSAEHYSDLINCYSDQHRISIPYVSDSNGYWRFHSADEIVTDNDSPTIQVLTHAEWWIERELSPRERIAHALFEDSFMHLQNYDDLLRKHGRENRSQIQADLDASGERNQGIFTFRHIYSN